MATALLILSAFLVVAECQNWTDSRVVQIDQGPVRGFKFIGDDVISFYSIPYATVTKRFQVAGPPPTWTETFDAFYRRIACAQQHAVFIDLSDHALLEDCLVLNIFLPDTNQTNLPVMVDIHGGAFYAGLGNVHRYTQFAAEKNVIVVTFNHRVGLLGFLCLGTPNIPGNAGLKDIIVALRWVQRNIASFGGNPADVTLSGCSAGGAAMDVLLLSKAAEGLFTRAIPESGSNLAAFTVLQNPTENAKEQARLLNFTDVDNIEAMEQFFLDTPFERFLELRHRSRPDTILDYAPCVERDVGQEIIVLEDAPYNILKSGNFTKYPLLYGLTDLEGEYTINMFDDWSVEMNENFGIFLPGDLGFEDDSQRREVGEYVKNFFFGSSGVNNSTVQQYLHYFSDTMFVYSVLRNLKLQVEAGHDRVFLYEYSYYDEGAPPGAAHCNQIAAVRDEDFNTLTEDYRRMKSFMREVWYNFIRTGNPVVSGSPVPSWPPLNQTNRAPHLSVGRQIELRGALVEARANFWDSIYDRYYSIPIPPHTDDASSIAINYVFLISVTLFRYIVW